MRYNQALKDYQSSESYTQFAERIVSASGIENAALRVQLIQAFSRVPRAEFIDPALRSRSLEDMSLPIGFSQTISRPSTLALILANLKLKPGERVLEVGAGCGYFSALLSTFGVDVFGIEYIAELAQNTRKNLVRLGYPNIVIRSGDGMRGWFELAPFDAIVISAAVQNVSPALEEQIVNGHGRIIAPLFIENSDKQQLVLGRKDSTSVVSYTTLDTCAFVTAR